MATEAHPSSKSSSGGIDLLSNQAGVAGLGGLSARVCTLLRSCAYTPLPAFHQPSSFHAHSIFPAG
jgi:hypothetical protein